MGHGLYMEGKWPFTICGTSNTWKAEMIVTSWIQVTSSTNLFFAAVTDSWYSESWKPQRRLKNSLLVRKYITNQLMTYTNKHSASLTTSELAHNSIISICFFYIWGMIEQECGHGSEQIQRDCSILYSSEIWLRYFSFTVIRDRETHRQTDSIELRHTLRVS